jgi:adenylate cyclase
MPTLVIEQPGVPSMTVPFSEGEVTIGRAEDNNVVLVADEVSRHHVKLLCRDRESVLVDLKSLNGTYVNRQRIVERLLAHQDEIWLGSKCRMVFRDDTGHRKGDTHPEHTSAIFDDLGKIREEIDRAATNLTMIGKQADSSIYRVDTPPPQATAEDLVAMSRAYRRLDALYKASKLIASDFDLDRRLSAILDTAIEVMEAERGFVLIRDSNTGHLEVSVAREMGQDLAASSPSMGIAGKSAIDGEPVLMTNSQDQQFGGRESIIRQNICSAMCVPLQVEDRILGSIYLDKRTPENPFTKDDLELFLSLASQSSMAIENSRLYEQTLREEKQRLNLGRFLSPAVVDEIMKEESTLSLGGRKRVVTTMFADIRGFTQIAEQLPPAMLVELLNEHFTVLTEIVFEHQGTLDKYNGDEIMALFGAPISSPYDAERAIRAAVAMQYACTEMNGKRAEKGQPILEVGIGINTGEVIAGYIGSPRRLDFTVIGDRVNTARRLCAYAEPGQIIIGEDTYAATSSLVEARAIGTVMLKGKANPTRAYEVTALKG